MTPKTGATRAAALLLVILAAHAGCGKPAAPPAAGSDEGDTSSPAVSVRFADIEQLQAAIQARHARGRPVLLNFWATWCAPCVQELPDLARLSREWSRENGPEVLGVSLDSWVYADPGEVEPKVRRQLLDLGVDYDNLIYSGEQDPLLNRFEFPGPIPYSILYDRTGKVVFRQDGTVNLDEVRRAAAAADRKGS